MSTTSFLLVVLCPRILTCGRDWVMRSIFGPKERRRCHLLTYLILIVFVFVLFCFVLLLLLLDFFFNNLFFSDWWAYCNLIFKATFSDFRHYSCIIIPILDLLVLCFRTNDIFLDLPTPSIMLLLFITLFHIISLLSISYFSLLLLFYISFLGEAWKEQCWQFCLYSYRSLE
jgi:hypothetical protein